MLRRVLIHADTKTRKIAYFSLVRSILEYGCIVWNPFFSKKSITRFEKIQNAALQFIFKLKGQVCFTEIRENPARQQGDLFYHPSGQTHFSFSLAKSVAGLKRIVTK